MEKEKKIWTRRWMADETAFSSVKRVCLVNICITATKFHNMVKEMVMKASLYNLFSSGSINRIEK
jgi:hypothetical protein